MVFRGDERAVTVQIGAVLLLAIVFAALALYQLNAVPAENERVEFTHNQAVHDELQELRNTIQNVGADGGTGSTAVTLGTQYPSRTVAANPPAPTGRLETTGRANISVDAQFAGDESEYDGNPNNLTGDHETTTLAYTPAYREYDSAPTTRIEHGFAFNDFGDAQVTLTTQPMLSDGTIRLVVLEGEFSRSGSGAVTIDSTALSGPSDPVPIEGEGDENVTITIPTNAPTAWNDTIGKSFDDGEPDAQVTDYDRSGDGPGSLTIELAEGEYDLQVTRVGIDDSATADGRYDVYRTSDTGGTDDGTGPAYRVSWQDPSGQSGVVDEECSASSCTVVGDSVDLTMATDGTAADAAVEYALNDSTVGTLSPTEGRTDRNGTHTTTFEVDSSAEDGDTVTVYTSSGSDGDRITLEISEAPYFDVAVTGTNEPVEEGDPLTVDVDVENLGAEPDAQTIGFALEDENGTVVADDAWTVELGGGERASHAFEWNTTEGDAGEYAALVRSDDTTDTADGLRVVEERAVLDLESVEGLADGRPDDEYAASVTVGEVAGVETDGLETRVVITDDTGATVYDQWTAADAEIAGNSTTITDAIGTLEEGDYEYTVTADANNAQAVETTGAFTVSSGPSLGRAEGWAANDHHNHGLQEAGFAWELSESTDLELRILDGSGTVVGSTTITGAATTGNATVAVTNGANKGGDAEPYPVVLEIEVLTTGETCSAELTEADDRVVLCN